MNIADIKHDIKNKTTQRLYFFTGNELGLMNMYVNHIAESREAKVVRTDSIAKVWSRLTNTATIFNNETVYVVRDDKDFFKSDKCSKYWEDRKLYELIKNNCLIVLITETDTRSKYIKTYKDDLIEFSKMTPTQLKKYVLKKSQLVEEEADYLIDVCNADYTQILNELDKLNRVSLPNGYDYIDLIEDIVNVKVECNSFGFVNKVLQRNDCEAFVYLNTLLEDGESGLGLLTLLYNNFRNAAQVVAYRNDPEATQKTGLSGWIVSTCKNTILKNYNPNDILNILRRIQYCEEGVKTGLFDERQAIEIATIEILSK